MTTELYDRLKRVTVTFALIMFAVLVNAPAARAHTSGSGPSSSSPPPPTSGRRSARSLQAAAAAVEKGPLSPEAIAEIDRIRATI